MHSLIKNNNMKLLAPAFIAFIIACNSPRQTTSADEISASAVTDMLRKGKPVVLKGKKITGVLDFRVVSEAIALREKEMKSPVHPVISFDGCEFGNEIRAFEYDKKENEHSVIFESPVSFSHCRFRGNVDLRSSQFQNMLLFRNCTFEKDVLLDNIQVVSDFDFTDCLVRGTGHFQSCFWGKNVNLFKSSFDSTVLFQSSFFNGAAQFNDVFLGEYSDFSLCSFTSKVFFNYARMGEKTFFNNSTFKETAEFDYAKFDNAEFRDCFFFMQGSFGEIRVSQLITFKGTKFLSGKPNVTLAGPVAEGKVEELK
jgi:uncharacterized protein YjbI with pentapeptide repeats